MRDNEIIIVFTQVPDIDCANKIATALIELKLAACVNISSPNHSIYHWQGQIEQAEEITVSIKTRRGLYSQVEATLLNLHPYDLPEIIYFDVNGGLPTYLNWVKRETLDSTTPINKP